MRMVVGIAVEDRVFEMALPATVPLVHLLSDIHLALVGATGDAALARLTPRRVDGEWLDLERSLDQQACVPGSLICLEQRGVPDQMRGHDPVAAIADRGPPTDLVPGGAVATVVGAVLGALTAASLGKGVVAVVAAAPLIWAGLPLVGGVATGASTHRVRRLLAAASMGTGAAAVAASGAVASIGPAGIGLDCCLAAVVLVHGGHRRCTNALARVALRVVEWWLVGAVFPVAAVAAGWSAW